MRMLIQVHKLRLSKRSRHRVIALCDILRIPVRNRRPRCHTQHVALKRELRIVHRLSRLFRTGIDFPLPAWSRDPPISYFAVGIRGFLRI